MTRSIVTADSVSTKSNYLSVFKDASGNKAGYLWSIDTGTGSSSAGSIGVFFSKAFFKDSSKDFTETYTTGKWTRVKDPEVYTETKDDSGNLLTSCNTVIGENGGIITTDVTTNTYDGDNLKTKTEAKTDFGEGGTDNSTPAKAASTDITFQKYNDSSTLVADSEDQTDANGKMINKDKIYNADGSLHSTSVAKVDAQGNMTYASTTTNTSGNLQQSAILTETMTNSGGKITDTLNGIASNGTPFSSKANNGYLIYNGSRRQGVAQRLYLNTFSIIFSIIVLCGLSFTQATAASFDCKKATTWVEKTICSDPELSKLDEEMAKAYQDALKSLSTEGQKETKQYQRQWLKEISPYCKAGVKFGWVKDVSDCLKNNYKERIKQLQQSLTKFPDRIFRNVQVNHSKIDKTCDDELVAKELTYPQIENPRNENEKSWNTFIFQKATDKFKSDKKWECTDINDEYAVTFNNKYLISIQDKQDLHEQGSVYSYIKITFFNWLLEARRELQISDLFYNKTGWRKKLIALIAQEKKKAEADDDSRLIAPGEDLETGLIDIDKITILGEWMISKDGLVFRLYTWNERGVILITIEWKTLEPYLSKNGHSLIF